MNKGKWITPPIIWCFLIAASFLAALLSELFCVYYYQMPGGCDPTPITNMAFPTYAMIIFGDLGLNKIGQFLALAGVDVLLVFAILKFWRKMPPSLSRNIYSLLLYIACSILFDIVIIFVYLSGMTNSAA